MIYRPKRWGYNKEVEVNSVSILRDKNYEVSYKKFRQKNVKYSRDITALFLRSYITVFC